MKEFIEFYKMHRVKNGKQEVSRTRTGMNSFLIGSQVILVKQLLRQKLSLIQQKA